MYFVLLVISAAKVDLLIYYLPIFTTLVLIARCNEQNKKNKRRYGPAWNTYCERVKSNLIPKVY
jgi:protein-S-isoprenylcysteine O-methyltransferase Ste14